MPYGEADVVVTLFTEALGRVSAMARGARRSGKRLGGALEPVHGVRVELDERPGSDLATLHDARVLRARTFLTTDLDRLDAAGHALRWVRRAAPPRKPEPELWAEVVDLLDHLDDRTDAVAPRTHLAASGLRILVALGWGLQLESCVRCGRACGAERAAFVDAARGGLLCRACGGSGRVVPADARVRLVAAAAGKDATLVDGDVALAFALVDEVLATHAGLEA